ncbi:MAG: phosphoribosylamine--glycine ligase [Bacteroidetes bacterium]|nr:phosphoribosylamine--glycine ligase [Bacteroidota bacterium]
MANSYNILLLGSGGRESALAWKLRQSPLCARLFIAPGNGGTSAFGENIPQAPTDFESLKTFCIENKIDILLPGNEDPLVAGIQDFFKADEDLRHIIVCGPSKAGAQLEGSKAFSKKFMQRHGIPTAAYRSFDKHSFEEGLDWLSQHLLPVVIKADGLAAGKGVIIAYTYEEARAAYTAMIQEAQFGEAGSRVVIEEFLMGIELSVFVLTDGEGYVLLPEAKDYKRIGEQDTGPNTGGMGAISPVPFADEAFMEKVIEKIIDPTIHGLQLERITYQGFIFFGLINVHGEPYVIEYNCRMGDPETEVVMPRLDEDLVALIVDMEKGKLSNRQARQKPQQACTVMLVSEGYPGEYSKGKAISGLEKVEGSLVFQAGTKSGIEGLVTSGGRVLAVTSLAENLDDALATSYRNAELISFEGKHCRRDIGWEFRKED